MKVKKTFSLNEEIIQAIIEYCQTHCINASAMTEKLWIDHLNENNNN